MIHLYYGNGKGKTTAALGLALRAAGAGKSVLICRFLKNNESGELVSLECIPNIEVMDCGCVKGFLPQLGEAEQAAAAVGQKTAFQRACRAMDEREYDLVVLDEVLWLKELGIVEESSICALAKKLGSRCEVVLTGGKAWDKIIACADYITHMEKIRHPYDGGTPARSGIEF